MSNEPKLKCGACERWERHRGTDVGKCFLKSYPDHTERWKVCDEWPGRTVKLARAARGERKDTVYDVVLRHAGMVGDKIREARLDFIPPVGMLFDFDFSESVDVGLRGEWVVRKVVYRVEDDRAAFDLYIESARADE